MYIPPHFREDDPTLLAQIMRENSFATLITCHEGSPFATHLPFLLDREKGEYGTLRAHMARANPQWHSFTSEQQALVIFQGAHAYISPAWYGDHASVPTWNYVAVHAYGIPRPVDDTTLYALLRDLVLTYETPREQPWQLSSLSEESIHKMMRAVVGFEIEITRLEGKLKLSQNQPDTGRNGAIAGLRQTGDPLNAAVAEWMERTAK